MTEPVALILNPSEDYGTALISYYWRQAGLRSVLGFTDKRSRRIAAVKLPIDHSSAIAGRVMLPTTPDPAQAAAELVADLRDEYDVRVVPTYLEHLVPLTTAITAALGLPWNTPAQMAPLRDKFAFKQLLRERAPQLRLNASMPVASAGEVLAADPQTYRRFVLKPRSGLGNRDVLIRDWPPDPDELAAYFDGRTGQAVLEEFVGGAEYHVNGQLDAVGEPAVAAVYLTNRGQVGDRSNMATDYWTVPTGDPRFADLSGYAEQVMRATGLVRTPFHMELKLDGDGPCLIEVGARLIGGGGWALDSWMHGPQCDLIAVAAHYWLSDQPRDLRLDWRHYDGLVGGRVFGSGESHGRIKSVSGAEALAASPGFRTWIKQPLPGQVVTPTVDTATTVWCFDFATPSREAAEALVRASRENLEIELVDPDDFWSVNVARGMRAARLGAALASSTWVGRRERR